MHQTPDFVGANLDSTVTTVRWRAPKIPMDQTARSRRCVIGIMRRNVIRTPERASVRVEDPAKTVQSLAQLISTVQTVIFNANAIIVELDVMESTESVNVIQDGLDIDANYTVLQTPSVRIVRRDANVQRELDAIRSMENAHAQQVFKAQNVISRVQKDHMVLDANYIVNVSMESVTRKLENAHAPKDSMEPIAPRRAPKDSMESLVSCPAPDALIIAPNKLENASAHLGPKECLVTRNANPTRLDTSARVL